jgi:exosortase
MMLVVLFSIVFWWAYRPTLARLWTAWTEEPDYSHGLLVLPFVASYLWFKRSSCPHPTIAWPGLVVILASILMRVAAVQYHAAPLDGWSIVVFLVGLVWLLGGLPLLRWSFPALMFLFFMVPLPYRVERVLNGPLRDLSTLTSCFMLQTVGEQAFSQGNTIWVPYGALQVERACSGLRIFMGLLAFSTAIAISIRGWLERVLLVLAAAPIGVLSNSVRVVATGLLLEHYPNDLSPRFSHDLSGWISPFVGAGLLVAFWCWLGIVFPWVKPEVGHDMNAAIRRQRARHELSQAVAIGPTEFANRSLK